MSVIVYGFVAPVGLALIVWIRTSVHPASRASDEPGAPGAPSTARSTSAGPPVGRWEGLTEEIAQRGNRRPRRLNDAAARRRHLAAVLPADPRH